MPSKIRENRLRGNGKKIERLRRGKMAGAEKWFNNREIAP
jgi:hypothetical protein